MEPLTKKSGSFTFSKSNINNPKARNCRTKLQNRFNESDCTSTFDRNNRSVLSVISFNETRKLFRTGAGKVAKAFNDFRTTLGSYSQRFRTSTKRRQILEEGPVTPGCVTPQTFSRTLLGRTPTKLYSPFDIDSPYNKPLTHDIKY